MSTNVHPFTPKADPAYLGQLRQSITVEQFARVLYMAAAEFHSFTPRLFEGLSHASQRTWRDAALEILRDSEPNRCQNGCGEFVQPGDDFCSTHCRLQKERE